MADQSSTADHTNLPHRSAPLTRSPIHLLTLLVGLALTTIGWMIATLFDAGVIMTTREIRDLITLLPSWMETMPDIVVSLGAFGVVSGATVWLLWTKRPRELLLAYVALAVGAATSVLVGQALLLVLEPDVRRLFDDLPAEIMRIGPTDWELAAPIAVLTLIRRWIPSRSRRAILPIVVFWLAAAALTISPPPHLGLVLDIGIGMVVGSAVALAFKTPSLQPSQYALMSGLARSGIVLTTLVPAEVDARGSKPWLGTTVEGQVLFVKALSIEQRAADLMFRGVRWLQLRRSGDPPPETTLKRAAEHEALVSHHVRSFDLPTPRLLAIADLGDNNVALAYEAIQGRSLDQLDPSTISDETLQEMWRHVALLHEHGVAHRDLRLANVFRRDDGAIALIDFGFAELAAEPPLLDADVAELLAATSAVVGVNRAVAAATDVIGTPAIERARDWLHPLALTRATRAQLDDGEVLEELRTEVERVTGHSITPYEPLGRLSAQRIVGMALLAGGLYSFLAVTLEGSWWPKVSGMRWDLIAWAAVMSLLAYPLSGAAARSLSAGKISRRVATGVALATIFPAAASTSWAWASHQVSKAARRFGFSHSRSRALAALWMLTGLAVAPIVATVFAVTGLREEYGLIAGTAYGTGIGVGLAAAELALIFGTPWGRELHRVWIHQHLADVRGGVPLVTSAGWWLAARSSQGAAAALAMRAVGVEAPIPSLVAIAVVASTLASLTPAPGGIGATEALLYLGLILLGEHALAGVAMVTARLVGYWVHVPLAWITLRELRSTRRPRARAREPERGVTARGQDRR